MKVHGACRGGHHGADLQTRATKFWIRRRLQHLLTGKAVCGVCGGPAAPIGKDQSCKHSSKRYRDFDYRSDLWRYIRAFAKFAKALSLRTLFASRRKRQIEQGAQSPSSSSMPAAAERSTLSSGRCVPCFEGALSPIIPMSRFRSYPRMCAPATGSGGRRHVRRSRYAAIFVNVVAVRAGKPLLHRRAEFLALCLFSQQTSLGVSLSVGAFSQREMVGCEHKSAPVSGSRRQASLKAGSERRKPTSLPSG